MSQGPVSLCQQLNVRLTNDTNIMASFVAYYRVSTDRQGASGLGLDAQRAAVKGFVRDGVVVDEVTEVESGKKDKRPGLARALEIAKKNGATLVVAKLDRLSRNASFVMMLRDSGVPFVCADMPEANTLTIGLLAVIAQSEREAISTRTKSALAEAKKRGKVLGTPKNLTDEARAASIATRRTQRQECTAWTTARLAAQSMRAAGATFRSIADQLNAAGYLTRTGSAFGPKTVQRILA